MKNRNVMCAVGILTGILGVSALTGCGEESTGENRTEVNTEVDTQGTETETEPTDVVEEETGKEDSGTRDDILPHEEGEYVVFGAYEQDNDLTNGPEPVEWIVVDKNENGTLLMSRYVLESHAWQPKSNYDPVNDENWREKLTWEQSELRQWMNSEFKNALFTENEQSYINLAVLDNPDNPADKYYIDAPATEDYLFVLSVPEIADLFEYTTAFYQETFSLGYFKDLVCVATPYAATKVFSEQVISSKTDFDAHRLADLGYSEDIIGLRTPRYWIRSSQLNTPLSRSAVGGIGVCGWGEGASPIEKQVDYECYKTNGGVRPCVYVNF